MKRILTAAILLALLLPAGLFLLEGEKQAGADAQEMAENFFQEKDHANVPAAKADGTPFQIAYVDIDPYPASGEMLYYLVEELIETGWITCSRPLPFDPGNTDARELIHYLAGQDTGKYLRFSDDTSYYLAVDGEAACRDSLSQHLARGEIDLILCMGTSPGTFVQEMHVTDVPVMVYFSVDPVGKGLSESDRYSGRDNWWCHVNYTVYNKQMQFYYDNLKFSRLGVVYYDETVGAMRAYRETAKKNDFQIVERKIDSLTENEDEEAYYDRLQNVFQSLIDDGIDCFVLGTDIIKDEGRIQEQIRIFRDAGIPVAAQNGEYYVKNGALMMVTASDARLQAPFIADTMAAILNGASPGDLNQEFFTPPYLSVNLNTAAELGIQIPEKLLISSEKIYAGGGQ